VLSATYSKHQFYFLSLAVKYVVGLQTKNEVSFAYGFWDHEQNIKKDKSIFSATMHCIVEDEKSLKQWF